ncbi:unnamed protein product, partial [Didymodactylos carnosus]
VKDQYSWIPLFSVKLFISQCDACSNRKVFPKSAAGQKPRCDIEMWKLLSDKAVLDEEQLPDDFIDELNELNLHEPEIDEKSDESNSSSIKDLQSRAMVNSLTNVLKATDPTPQALDLSLAVPSSPVLTLTPKSKNRRRARIFSNISSPVSRHSVSEQNEHISE